MNSDSPSRRVSPRQGTVKILKSLTNSICPFTILVPMFKAYRSAKYQLVMTDIAMENPLKMEVLKGKSSMNGSFSMAMFSKTRE